LDSLVFSLKQGLTAYDKEAIVYSNQQEAASRVPNTNQYQSTWDNFKKGVACLPLLS
jgi:hypothetical protein